MANYYLISGYWKDDNTTFSNYLVKDTDDHEPGEDEHVFYFGISEKEIQQAIDLKEYSEYEFVIESYTNPYKLQVNNFETL